MRLKLARLKLGNQPKRMGKQNFKKAASLALLSSTDPSEFLRQWNIVKEKCSIDNYVFQVAAIISENTIREGKATSYILESSSLGDFLDQASRKYLSGYGSGINGLFGAKTIKNPWRTICIYSQDISFAYTMHNDEAGIVVSGYDSENMHTGTLATLYETASSDVVKKGIRRLVGLSLYLECFPDSVSLSSSNSPNSIDLFNAIGVSNKGVVKMIGSHPSILDNSGPTPHFRNAHFRRLESECYTKKKGQVILVRGCFVKGKAFFVEDIIG